MSTEINTRGMIRSKVSSFPAGNDTECLSKSEILSQSGQDAYVNGSYGNTECARIDDVKQISGIYSGSYFFTNPDGTNTDTSTTEVQVSISNGVATIHFVEIWYVWMSIGEFVLKVNIENGVLVKDISWEAAPGVLFIGNTSGSVDGSGCNINFDIYYVEQLHLKFTGVKQ